MNNMQTDFLKGKTVLVTGGTGSFGNRFVERLLNSGTCKKIVVLSRDELKQHHMRQKFADLDRKLRFFLGDVRDLPRLQRAFDGVDVVVHAAALKQVPALEYNPLEAVRTNVLGTQNVIDAALDNKVDKVLLVSTDKAVNPINLYGATKLCAEKLLIAGNSYAPGIVKFSAVRYGNVLGSRGSIVEVLGDQKKKGVVTLTDEAMTRFWITLDQGVDLVLHALNTMKGGEIFLPKLSAMKVKDLMTTIAPGCEIKVIGIRPGEKLHESLLTEDEARRTRDTGKYYAVEPHCASAENNWWNAQHFGGHPRVDDSFRYASDSTPTLSKEDLQKMLDQ